MVDNPSLESELTMLRCLTLTLSPLLFTLSPSLFTLSPSLSEAHCSPSHLVTLYFHPFTIILTLTFRQYGPDVPEDIMRRVVKVRA